MKRLPKSTKAVRGTLRPSREKNRTNRTFSDESPSVPSWMRIEAHAYFDKIVEKITEIGLASDSFSYFVGLAAERMLEIDECNAHLKTSGAFYETDRGIRVHPALKRRDVAMKHLDQILSSLGLSPSGFDKAGGMVKSARDNPFSKNGIST